MNEYPTLISQPSHVFRPDELPTLSRGGGARTIPLVTAARGATTYLNGITIFPPGSQIAHHLHNVAESVMVIQGNATVDINGQRSSLRTFDTTFVPANIAHHFENASDTEDMRIFWTYGSLDATRTVIDSGEHGRVDGEGNAEAAAGTPRIIREITAIHVREGHEASFEQAVAEATPLFQNARGARNLTLDRSLQQPRRYQLTVSWEPVEEYIEAFRNSSAFARWRELIDDHITTVPTVEQVRNVWTAF